MIDPQKLMETQKVTKYIKAEMRIDYANSRLELFLGSEVPESAAVIPDMLKQLGEGLATQMSAFFAIQGKITETGKQQ